MSWVINESQFNSEKIAANGNKFLIGNGYMGYRGTLEEFTKDEYTACILAGVYDRVGESWRELVNAPNGLYTKLFVDGEPISVLSSEIVSHNQELDIKRSIFTRTTVFRLPNGGILKVHSERFVSANELQLIGMRYAFECSIPCSVTIETGIDADVWDLNGPHLHHLNDRLVNEHYLLVGARTQELQHNVIVAEHMTVDWDSLNKSLGQRITSINNKCLRVLSLECLPNQSYQFEKIVVVYSNLSEIDSLHEVALNHISQAHQKGYSQLKQEHIKVWDDKWQEAAVEIKGDPEAELALNYSIYQLLIAAPTHSEKLSIPARALSGQVYKGAVFWDTEMFMLPFFLYTDPEVARNLLFYRVHTLDGARRKANEYGYRGAFYAWESQDSGDDACTLFNINDVFTGRPMRTYFRDKQIHISADVALAIWSYVQATGDEGILVEGAAEVILECARFFNDYVYYRPTKQRYEVLDVTGPDEYHERVNNNAYTNYLVAEVFNITFSLLDHLKANELAYLDQLVTKLNIADEIEQMKHVRDHLYLPKQDDHSKLIEQFDGYFKLKDIGVSQLKEQMLHPHEYLGGGSGLATTTQVLKQADTILMLHLFHNQFDAETIKKNWDYYEPRTEHGSSLSSCVYGIVGAKIGYTDYAYHYFQKTATIDLTGNSKLFVGDLYIGGTHPAANGGAWMAAIQGFAGLEISKHEIVIRPKLPKHWEALRFHIIVRGQRYTITIEQHRITIHSSKENEISQLFILNEEQVEIRPKTKTIISQ